MLYIILVLPHACNYVYIPDGGGVVTAGVVDGIGVGIVDGGIVGVGIVDAGGVDVGIVDGGIVGVDIVDAGGVGVGGDVVAVRREKERERVMMHVNHVKLFA